MPAARVERKTREYLVDTDEAAVPMKPEAITMQAEPVRREPYPSVRRVQIVRKRRPREPEPLDLRTPSGRVLPY